MSAPPCVLFEDEHLLVVNKPAGWNTHAPAPFAGEGLYDWLRHREPRWTDLAIVQRLDKETSGVIVFGKTPRAHRSLTEQFTRQTVRKHYVLLTDRPVPREEFVARSRLVRAGERYRSGAHGQPADTHFAVRHRERTLRVGPNGPAAVCTELLATPRTGRTHQIRVHAAEQGFPVLGDTRYGGSPWPRVCLHAAELAVRHPVSGAPLVFRAPADFEADIRWALRTAIIEPEKTNAFRLVHGAGDDWPGWYVDRLADFLFAQGHTPLTAAQRRFLATLCPTKGDSGLTTHAARLAPACAGLRGVYHRTLPPPGPTPPGAVGGAQHLWGAPAAETVVVRENGVLFELRFAAGGAGGLFLDQRDNRRRLLTGHIAAGFPLCPAPRRNGRVELLNCFAYTCGFSLCAALAGARTTSLDLSPRHLQWGKRNFTLNGLEPAAHEFLHGDVFSWLRRLARKGRAFDVIVLDPPTFSRSKEHGVFQVRKDFDRLVAAALPLLKPDGVLFCSTNAADWAPEAFLATIHRALAAARRVVLRQHYCPQPPDFPISRAEPAYLKTVWLQVQ